MSVAAKYPVRPLDLLAPALLLAALLAVVGTQTGLWRGLMPTHPDFAPATSTIPTHPYSFRAAGDFLRDGVPVDGPLVTDAAPAPLEIMTFEVTATDYARCVADAACEPAEPRRQGKGDVPVTGVSFDDATAMPPGSPPQPARSGGSPASLNGALPPAPKPPTRPSTAKPTPATRPSAGSPFTKRKRRWAPTRSPHRNRSAASAAMNSASSTSTAPSGNGPPVAAAAPASTPRAPK